LSFLERIAVRLHFQAKPWDLYLSFAYTTVISVALLSIGIGNYVAIFTVIFFPGYVLLSALFPTRNEIDWIERIALSFGLSIAVTPLLTLVLNFTPWGINLVSVVGAIDLFMVLAGIPAYRRRMRLPASDRLSMTFDVTWPSWGDYTTSDKILTACLTMSIGIAGATLAYVLTSPELRERFTEFYLLGPGGNASGYPTALNISQRGSVILGIVNHEAMSVSYTVRIDLVGVRVSFNATSGSNETVEVNRTTWSTFNVTLADGRNWTQPYTFQINDTGLWKVQFLLFKDGDVSSAYRKLHLYVTVT